MIKGIKLGLAGLILGTSIGCADYKEANFEERQRISNIFMSTECLDNQAPQLSASFEPRKPRRFEDVEIMFNYEDPDSNKFSYSVNTGNETVNGWETAVDGSAEFIVNTGFRHNGKKIIQAEATDSCGNSSSLSFVIPVTEWNFNIPGNNNAPAICLWLCLSIRHRQHLHGYIFQGLPCLSDGL